MREVWPHWYGPCGPGDAVADLAERARSRGLPVALVALDGSVPIGTVTVGTDSHGARPGEGPWLIGLAVAAPYRGHGLGSALAAAAESAAAHDGAETLYATTAGAKGLLCARGWRELRRLPDGNVVLAKPLRDKKKGPVLWNGAPKAS
ncbi:GNAT family N-acetyltransferase [Wenxinia marina]|uniref:N-acetylglutamate synthase n=1 Tax=Wenxinia marina DSM 24838 TaxID=1123501 RepID=A0A0D0QK26_9RHOB|nr:GNAT family N-acetyltransferase [Wenxinia marina]KIQ71363.1 N-acetylglutamate synthase [Wenxinia marina DSM 24838]GGL81312.1 hypothetical protein GCM10011392_39900 [Wenxinia marina]